MIYFSNLYSFNKFLTLEQKHKLRVFDIKVPSKVFGP
jgi:hypothetical protein